MSVSAGLNTPHPPSPRTRRRYTYVAYTGHRLQPLPNRSARITIVLFSHRWSHSRSIISLGFVNYMPCTCLIDYWVLFDQFIWIHFLSFQLVIWSSFYVYNGNYNNGMLLTNKNTHASAVFAQWAHFFHLESTVLCGTIYSRRIIFFSLLAKTKREQGRSLQRNEAPTRFFFPLPPTMRGHTSRDWPAHFITVPCAHHACAYTHSVIALHALIETFGAMVWYTILCRKASAWLLQHTPSPLLLLPHPSSSFPRLDPCMERR